MYRQIGTLTLLTLLLGGPTSAIAQDEEPVVEEDSRKCISVRSIRRTRVVDDRNILFYGPGKTIYRNTLTRACPGLARENRFGYKTSVGSLCRNDRVSVLHADVVGVREGVSCGLGDFVKISAEEADAMLEKRHAKPEPEPIDMPEPGEVDAEPDDEPEEER